MTIWISDFWAAESRWRWPGRIRASRVARDVATAEKRSSSKTCRSEPPPSSWRSSSVATATSFTPTSKTTEKASSNFRRGELWSASSRIAARFCCTEKSSKSNSFKLEQNLPIALFNFKDNSPLFLMSLLSVTSTMTVRAFFRHVHFTKFRTVSKPPSSLLPRIRLKNWRDGATTVTTYVWRAVCIK